MKSDLRANTKEHKNFCLNYATEKTVTNKKIIKKNQTNLKRHLTLQSSLLPVTYSFLEESLRQFCDSPKQQKIPKQALLITEQQLRAFRLFACC